MVTFLSFVCGLLLGAILGFIFAATLAAYGESE